MNPVVADGIAEKFPFIGLSNLYRVKLRHVSDLER